MHLKNLSRMSVSKNTPAGKSTRSPEIRVPSIEEQYARIVMAGADIDSAQSSDKVEELPELQDVKRRNALIRDGELASAAKAVLGFAR